MEQDEFGAKVVATRDEINWIRKPGKGTTEEKLTPEDLKKFNRRYDDDGNELSVEDILATL
jgi:hypothetical protein